MFQPGCRTHEVTLVTTLLDPVLYPAIELAGLYGQRCQIETNLRHLKQTLHMDVLRTKTVAGIQKELAMFALVYNLVRLVMLRDAVCNLAGRTAFVAGLLPADGFWPRQACAECWKPTQILAKPATIPPAADLLPVHLGTREAL